MKKMIAIILLILLVQLPQARIINVPGEYATIQGGIDAALNGDTVLVAPGVYAETLLVENKNIVLRSNGLPDSTIIQGYVSINGSSIDTTCILQGFKILRTGDFDHDLLVITGASPKIQGNIIQGLEMWPGTRRTGVDIIYSNAIIRSNIIRDNVGRYNGHGIQAWHSSPLIEGNVIINNGANGNDLSVGGWGIGLDSGILRYNVVFGNFALSGENAIGGGICLGGGPCEIANNTIVGNSSYGGIGFGDGGGLEIRVPFDGDSFIVRNNIIYNNWYHGVIAQIFDSSWTGWDYNLVYWNDTIDYVGMEPGPHDVQADPRFVDQNSRDFHLLPGSPCIDSGDPDSPLDPDSTLADIGAYYFDQAVGIDEPGPSGPYRFALSQNYPNPFNARTVISYSIDQEAIVSLRIMAITGQLVKTISYSENQAAGEYRIIWEGTNDDGKPVSTGIYFYELSVGDYRESKAMIIVK